MKIGRETGSLMTWSNKVTWSEGLFLRPQLFQQQERYLESFAHLRAQVLSPFYWGFSQYQIDHQSLVLGKLVLASACGLFADGTPFDVPSQTMPPPPLTLTPEHLNQVIHLALAIRVPNGEETNFEDAVDSPARFSVFEAELRDANSIGQGAKTVQLSRLRLRLIPEKELGSAWMGLPLAKVIAIQSNGSVELEPTLIPPINRYGASELINQWLVQIHGHAEQRGLMLAHRLTGQGVASGVQAAEITDLLLLQIINRYESLLDCVLKIKETPPEDLYILLKSMAAELSAYMRYDTRRPRQVPDYHHVDPYLSFKVLVDDVRELLNIVLVRSAQNIPLEIKQHGMRLASVDPIELKSFSSLVLAVSASVPTEQLAKYFPDQSKIGPSDRLSELVRFHLPGIPIVLLPVPPRQIPYNAGFVYFQVESRGALWESMVSTGGIALHIANELPQLCLELWGIN